MPHTCLRASLNQTTQNNILPAALHPRLGMRDYASVGLFAGSFFFEVIADRQKTAWRNAKDAKEHDEKFITSGLWSISRHPKYAINSARKADVVC